MKQMAPNLFRGSKEERFAAIQAGEVEVCINLETETRELILGGANNELLLCIARGVRFWDFALSGIMPPERGVAQAILDVIETSDVRKRIVFGCRACRERGGFIAAVYRMQIQKWSFDAAYAEWKAEGCRWPTYWLWKSALRKWGVK